MLDLLLKAIDRLIDLQKIKDKRAKVRYDEIYKPSFADLQAVHADYLSMFVELDARLRKLNPRLGGNDPVAVEALEYLRVRRTALLPIRRKLITFRIVVRGEKGSKLPREELAFLESILDYFFVTGIARRTTAASTVIEVLEDAIDSRVYVPSEQKYSPVTSIKDVQTQCRDCMAKLEELWAISTERFNDLRFKYADGVT